MTFDAGSGKVISDGVLLSTDAIPGRLVGRQEQAGQLLVCLAPMLKGLPPMNVWLHGPPGSGKTLLAKSATGEVCASGANRPAVYVNCWQHRTLYSVSQAIINELRILGAEAQNTNIKLDRIRQLLRDRPMVIILDEIDRPMPAARENIVRALIGLPKTGLLCIANSTHALAMLDEGVGSRLNPVVVELPRYSAADLEMILIDRAEQALVSGSWSHGTIRQIARHAGGDARVAITALRQAAAVAEGKGRLRLDTRFVQHSLAAQQFIREEARVASLSEHEKIIHGLAVQHSPVGTTELARLYVVHCRACNIQPIARRTFSKYVGQLSSAGLVSLGGYCGGSGGRLVRAT